MQRDRETMIISVPGEKWQEALNAISAIDGAVIKGTGEVYHHPLFTFRANENSLSANGNKIILTLRECQLMQTLSAIPNAPLSLDELALLVFESKFVLDSDRTNLRILVGRVRKKLRGLVGDKEVIETVRNRGYKLVDLS